MSMNHTPGPWGMAAGISTGIIWNILSPEPNSRPLAGVFHAPDPQVPMLVAMYNARLIAKAPQLLAALAALVNCPDYRGIQTLEMDAAKALLRDMEGRI